MTTHAIVIGGGIAGLLAAHVLANHFEHVTIIERDFFPPEPEHRAGTPQDRQVHTMLLRGQRELERMFPGLEKKLLAAGAIERDFTNESLNYYGGARCPKIPSSPLSGWNASRILAEWLIRQEIAKNPHIEVREGYEVVSLLSSSDKSCVTGVQMRPRDQAKVAHEKALVLESDLVVDASGLSSPTPQWLMALGYPTPKEEVVNPKLGYATRFYQATALPWKNIAIQATEGSQRGGVLMSVEAEQWMVVLAGGNGDYPPTDPAAYLEFARSLPDPALYDAIKDASPLSPIYGYRRTENRWRHFERMKRWPEGFVALGDAVCVFNPLYGQGMTVAALEAIAFDEYLRRNMKRKELAHSFQKQVARIITFPWLLAASSDARLSQGRRPNPYIENLVHLLPRDQEVLLRFLEVIHMLRSPIALFHPLVVVKVVTHWHKRK